MFKKITLMVTVMCFAVTLFSQTYKNPKAPVEDRVNDLLSKMTLEEKVAQMNMTSLGNMNKNGKLGIGVCESPFIKAEDVAIASAKAKKFARDSTRLGIPPIQIAECLHGFLSHGSTVFPQAIAQGSTWNPEIIKEMSAVIAMEAYSAGVDQGLSPLFDIIRDARYGRVEECYSEDGFLTGKIGTAFVIGMQGEPYDTEKGISENKIMCTAKHFAGYTAPIAGINLGPSSIGEREMRSTHLPPFEMAVKDANIYVIMPSYNEIDGIAAHGSKFLLQKVLRDEWKFKGYVFADYGAIDMMRYFHKMTPDAAQTARKAVEAGVDLEAPMSDSYHTLVDQVQKGFIDEALIDTCVKRILRVKFKAGLFEKTDASPEKVKTVLSNPQHKELAQKVAEEAIILMKNDNKLLPLDVSKNKKIAVIGPNANQVQYGDYSYTKGNNSGVTILSGLAEKLAGKCEVSYAKGCSIAGMDKSGFSEAVECASAADVVVFVMGGTSATLSGIGWGDESTNKADDPNTCGEGFDVTDLNPHGVQRELLQEIYNTGKPVVLVLVHGRPWSITWEKENIPAIVEAWYPGERGGVAVANILTGEVNPSGRLSVTIPQSVGHVPVFYDYKPSGRGFYKNPGSPEKPGRDYVFSSPSPLFPFGYGLSYTTFEYSNLIVSKKRFNAKEDIIITVDVKNTGDVAGKEVVQLYINDKMSSVTTPVMQLKGFSKETLLPGEVKRVSFRISPKDLTLWNENMERVTEQGEFEIMIGRNAEDIVLKESVEFYKN